MNTKEDFCYQGISFQSEEDSGVGGGLEIKQDGNRFCVIGRGFNIGWLLDTASNRKAVLVFIRLFRDKAGKPLYTHQELSEIVGSKNRQASSSHMEQFHACGGDILKFLSRRRKVDGEVVGAVLSELKKDPLKAKNELCQEVKRRLSRDDLTEMNIQAALEQIPYEPLYRRLREQLNKGEVHYQEDYLLQEVMNSFSSCGGEQGGMMLGEVEGMKVSDPTGIRNLLTPEVSLSCINKSLQIVCFVMALYHHEVGLSVLGKWLKVHKTTILRWILGLSLELWPIVWSWVKKGVKTRKVYIDEKWLKIQKRWYYWFVVLDEGTGLPIITSLLASRGVWACRWIGYQMKKLGQIPKAIITDGMVTYKYLKEILGKDVEHLLCHFHYQQVTSRWVKENFKGNEQLIKQRKKELKEVLQTNDKRTVKRRFEKLRGMAEIMGIQRWVSNMEEALPKLLPAIGSKKFPKTNNAIERFFRDFNQFYKRRCGFFSVMSARREIISFLVMYLFLQQPGSCKAPLEMIMPEVKNMPFYQLVNNPLGCLLGLQNVKLNKNMAENRTKQCLGP
ncbi:MAG: hypothetical protein AB1422_10650 [bacterium]